MVSQLSVSATLSSYDTRADVVDIADHVCVPDFLAAMENWGLVLYQDVYFLWNESKSTMHDKYMVTMVIAHEVSHTVSMINLTKSEYMDI